MHLKLFAVLVCLFLALTMLSSAALAVNCLVTTTADDGDGSLRHAIESANANPGTAVIFNIPTADSGYADGVFTIKPTSALPNISANGITIDGSTQTAFTGDTNTAGPEIVVNGSLSGSGTNGFYIVSSDCAIKNLVVNSWPGTGIVIWEWDAHGNSIIGCYVGTDASGTAGAANGGDGVGILRGAHGNTIGGTDPAARNIISGNVYNGVACEGSGNYIKGNYIGTNVPGTAAIPNGYDGVSIGDGASGNTVGGTTAGAANVISGNARAGVRLINSGTTNNLLQGNCIGTNATGTAAIPNILEGVIIIDGASGNMIGGTTAAAANIISGNAGHGVGMWDSGTTNNRLQGNRIGTNAAGTAALMNGFDGVLIANGASGNTIGGTQSGAGNTISGNYYSGIGIHGSSNNTVQGNLIGTNALGTAAIPNRDVGVWIGDSSPGNIVGGTVDGARNVISGNGTRGVLMVHTGTSGNTVQGNYIGTNALGTAAIPNILEGVIIIDGASGNMIGGTTAAAANIISGNTGHGVGMWNSGTTNNLVQGNRIGTNMAGTSALANNGHGVLIVDGASGNSVGGAMEGAGNVISGNSQRGVSIEGAGASGNSVAGNRLGTNATGTAAIPNSWDGVAVCAGATGNTIGGTTAGAVNIISGNTGQGVYIANAGTSGNVVQGNYIGTNAAGTAAVTNGQSGVLISYGASGNTIGGTTAGSANIISGNTGCGVWLSDSGTTNNLVQGNRIGTNASGTVAVANVGIGVSVANGASANTIGGTTAGAGNIISGNTDRGVRLGDAGTTNNLVQGNYIGTNATGATAIPNGYEGALICCGASGNTIGGTTAGAANIISGNTGDGVALYISANNLVQGNYIGTNATGTAAVANHGDGVAVLNGASGNTIGGTVATARNIISGNGERGMELNDALNNLVQGNYIGTNASGAAAIPNVLEGVIICNGTSNTIGGTTAGAANIISGNTGDGVCLYISANNNLVQGNYIGTNATGTVAVANHGDGVAVLNGASGNTIGGTVATARNIISGNHNSGVYINGSGTNSNIVQGNYIGTNAVGTAAVANGNCGVYLTSQVSGNTIGGTSPSARNIISGNAVTGVGIRSSATANSIQGNYIGLNAAGTAAVPNAVDGVGISAGAPGNFVGGSEPGAGNVISGNNGDGVGITDSGSSNNIVQGNHIGTNANGTAAVANKGQGVYIRNAATANTIGGTTAGAGNVISGNTCNGLLLSGAGTTNNLVQGNMIGPNTLTGVSMSNSPSNNTIGGTEPGAGNVISGNGLRGVAVWNVGSTGNKISGNSIHSNALLGIDLVGGTEDSYGVTTNHTGTVSGPNNLQNYPVLAAAYIYGGQTTVAGTLNGANSTAYTIEFFSSPAKDPSGYGEGQTYLGSQTATTNASGNASFAANMPLVTPGDFITATATDPAGNTSEFSAANGCLVETGFANAKAASDTTTVFTKGIVTYLLNTFWFYAEAEDRSSGIIVSKASHGLQVGQRVLMVGNPRTSASNLERCLMATYVGQAGSNPLDPIFMPNRTVGGGDSLYYDAGTGVGQKGIKDAAGLNNIGLLISTIGTVTFSTTGYFYIDDGSGVLDNSGKIGVKVLGAVPGSNPVGKHVVVTGISTCFKAVNPSTDLYRQIRAAQVTLLD